MSVTQNRFTPKCTLADADQRLLVHDRGPVGRKHARTRVEHGTEDTGRRTRDVEHVKRGTGLVCEETALFVGMDHVTENKRRSFLMTNRILLLSPVDGFFWGGGVGTGNSC